MDDPAGPFDTPYEGLAQLPREVWLPTLVAAVGRREERLRDARAWLRDLDAGELPPAGADFGDPLACAPLRAAAGELGLPGLARGLPVFAQQVLRTLLWHLDRIVDLQPRLSRAAAIGQVSVEFRAAWQRDSAGLEEALALLRELGDGAHPRWDEIQGRLRSREWQLAQRAADRLARLPEIVELLRRLGRSEARAAPSARAAPQRPRKPQRVPLRAVETRIDGAPGELTGIRFSASVERMLPAEAALLRHPIGRRLWRARHAEGRLLAHDTQAVLVDWHPDPAAAACDASRATGPEARERGPIVLCLDTSGSMRGAPENVAKAVAIAALRTAKAERRGCRLIAFGGPGEVIERDLGGEKGLAALLELMGQGFDGGTDIQTPIERAIERIHEAAWASADLLVVSDGEFGCVRQTLQSLDEARRQLGLRVQGVLIGDRETLGMLEVCDAIHWVRDWRHHADDGGAAPGGAHRGTSPVHSKSLTALYFPNALSAYAARHNAAPVGS